MSAPAGAPPAAGAAGTRLLVRVLGVLIVAMLLAGALYVWWWHWGPGNQDVVILGDSITFLTRVDLESGLGFRYDTHVDGFPSARADQRVDQARALAAAQPDQVVINLGSNDVLQDWPLDQTTAALEQLGTSFAGARCVVFVLVNEDMISSEDTGLHDRAAAVNTAISGLAARHGWRTIAWNTIVHDYVARGEPEGPITTDSIHPTEVGRRLLVDATYQALASC